MGNMEFREHFSAVQHEGRYKAKNGSALRRSFCIILNGDVEESESCGAVMVRRPRINLTLT